MTNYKPYEEFDGDELPEVDQKAMVLHGDGTELDFWTGGVDYTAEIARLPERITFDKKAGLWQAEGIEQFDLTGCKLVAATTLWAIWSERVGQPEDMRVGARPAGGNHEMGLRLIFEMDELLYYWDCFGITFKSAQGAVRRASKTGGWFSFIGSKQVNTRFGMFVVPSLEKVDEGGRDG